jgi:hypothetical protein
MVDKQLHELQQYLQDNSQTSDGYIPHAITTTQPGNSAIPIAQATATQSSDHQQPNDQQDRICVDSLSTILYKKMND